MKRVTIILLLTWFFRPAIAQVPGTLSYQGILMQNDGITPIADGAHSIVFNFYTTSSGGSALFSRTISVTTTKGLYTCIIGGGSAPNAPFIAAEKDQLGSLQIFVGIAVDGGSELLPRAQLTTSPYSLRSESITNTANPAGGNVSFWGANNTLSSDAGLSWDNTNKWLGIGGYVGIGTSTPAGSLDIKGSDGNLVALHYTLRFTRPNKNYIHAISPGGHFYFTVNGNADTNASMVIAADGNVGIGTVAPATPLHLKGNARLLRLEGTDHCYIEFYPDGPATRKAFLGFGGVTDNNFYFANDISGANIVFQTTGGGNVGIGTTTPGYDLELVGSAGKSTGINWVNTSDKRIKTDIQDIANSLDIIKRLRPVKFRYTDEWRKRFPSIKDHYYYSFVAQEFQNVFPESVMGSGKYLDGDPIEILSIDVSNAQIAAIKAIQEQQVEIEELKAINKSLEKRLQAIESLMSKYTSSASHKGK